MSNSKLVDYVKISPNKSSPRNHKIDTVSIHCMAGQLSVETCGEVFQNRAASSNYGIGPDGRIGLYVSEGDRSWCTSNADNDNRAVTIEVASDSTEPYAVTKAAYDALISLLTDICKRNKIKQLLWKGDRSLIGKVSKQNMTVHRWFSAKACPGEYLYNRHADIANRVNARLKGVEFVDDGSEEGLVGQKENTYIYNNPLSAVQDFVTPVNFRVSTSSSNSSLVNYVNRLALGQKDLRTVPISCITIHIARKIGDIYDLAQMLNSSERCYNYGIDNLGTIGLFVDEGMWTTSSNSKENDTRSVNIICMNKTLAPDYTISDECYESLVKLCEDICRRNFMFGLKYTRDPENDSITFHDQFNASSQCPGPYVKEKVKKMIERINKTLDVQVGVNFVQVSSRLASNEAEALRAQSTVAVKSIKPYVIFPAPSETNINFASLKEIGVIGAMLNAGERYNDAHELVTYRTQNVYNQTLDALAVKMPHAYVYTTHARTEDEVKEEAYWFRFVASKYPPKLGVWLHCKFDVTESIARKLVDKWYSYFVEWGFKSKCGIYATLKQAKKIGWPAQATYMPLWLEGELTDSVCPDEELLTPAFFKLAELETTPSTAATSQVDSKTTVSKSESIGTAKKEKEGTYTSVTIPKDSLYTGFKSWTGYTSITNKSTRNYKITHSSETTTDDNGFRKVDGRFLVIVGSGISTTVGTYMDVILKNGTVIKCIMGDGKADIHTDKKNHIFSVTTQTHCCSGFVVDSRAGVLNSLVRRMGDCSYVDDSWKSPVKSIKVYNKNWFDN